MGIRIEPALHTLRLTHTSNHIETAPLSIRSTVKSGDRPSVISLRSGIFGANAMNVQRVLMQKSWKDQLYPVNDFTGRFCSNLNYIVSAADLEDSRVLRASLCISLQDYGHRNVIFEPTN